MKEKKREEEIHNRYRPIENETAMTIGLGTTTTRRGGGRDRWYIINHKKSTPSLLLCIDWKAGGVARQDLLG